MILITWLLARFYGWSSIWTNKYWHVQLPTVPIWCQRKTDRIIFVFHSTLSKLIISKKGTWIFRQLNGEERSEEKICIFKTEKRRSSTWWIHWMVKRYSWKSDNYRFKLSVSWNSVKSAINSYQLINIYLIYDKNYKTWT